MTLIATGTLSEQTIPGRINKIENGLVLLFFLLSCWRGFYKHSVFLTASTYKKDLRSMNYFLAVILLKTSDMPSNIHCLRHTRSGGPIVYHTPTQLAMLSEEKLHVFPYVRWFFYNRKGLNTIFFILMFFSTCSLVENNLTIN